MFHIFRSFIITAVLVSTMYAQQNEYGVLNGPYLGQKPPGEKAMIFAPGIVSFPERSDFALAFSPDGNELFYTMWQTDDRKDERIWHMKMKTDGSWSEAKKAPFTVECFEYKTFYRPDGNRLFFLSKRPLPGESEHVEHQNIWYVDKEREEWGEPILVKFPEEGVQPRYISVSGSGTIYFNRTDKPGIYSSDYVNGKYQIPVPLADEINSLPGVSHPFISPDENYLIVGAPAGSGHQGDYDLFISFKLVNGKWAKPVNMGNSVNTETFDACATVTVDGKYIFFNRFVNGQSDIYWIESTIIEELKQKVTGKD